MLHRNAALRSIHLLAAACLALLAAAQCTVTTSKPVYAPGEEIVLNYAGFPGDPKDWLVVSPASMSDEQTMGNWKWTGGATSGSMSFAGLQAGEYEARAYYRNETSNVRCRYRFRIGNADTNTRVKTQKDVYAPGEAIVVDFSGFPGDPKDWITVSPADMKDDANLGNWQYTGGKQSGQLTFGGITTPGEYEARGYFNNEYTVRVRYRFRIGTPPAGTQQGCACQGLGDVELSTFYAGMGGLGSAWGRAASEPAGVLDPGAVADMQAVIGNAKAALTQVNMIPCVRWDVGEIDRLIASLPGMTNTAAVTAIVAVIQDLQLAFANTLLEGCGVNTLRSLYLTGIHIGAAQAWASSRMLRPTPMPGDIQRTIMDHLRIAETSFSEFRSCVPNFPMTSITNVPVGSMLSVEPHISVIMVHTNILWNIALTKCCCVCKG
jgi:hypothetical protein